MSDDTKKCPYCAETIKKEAIFCRYCRRDVAPGDPASPGEPYQVVDFRDEEEKESRQGGCLETIVTVVFLPIIIPVRLSQSGQIGKLLAAGYIVLAAVIVLGLELNSSETEDSPAQTAGIEDSSEAEIDAGGDSEASTPTVTATPEPTPTPTGTASTTPSPTPTAVGSLTVVSNGNLRGGPGTHYSVVATAVAGDDLPVYGRTDDGWFQVDGTGDTWIAGILISTDMNFSEVPTPKSIPPTPTATPSPTATPTPNRTATSRAMSRGATATARRQQVLNATATVEAYVHSAPSGTWCDQNSVRRVCVGNFRYANRAGYSSAPANGRFIAFTVAVANGSASDIVASGIDVSLVMEDGRTYDYASETYSYWATPLGVVTVAPGDSAQGGIVFLVPNDVAPRRIIYRGGFFESAVEIDLFSRPDS